VESESRELRNSNAFVERLPRVRTRCLLVLCLLVLCLLVPLTPAIVSAQEAVGGTLELSGSIRQVHDPVIAHEDGKYYLYSTGTGVPVRCSEDLSQWRLCSAVFWRLPQWAPEQVPGVTDIWAPDVSFFNGRYHLYYSLSTFGSNTSAIGLATNVTLDPDAPGFEWVDEGLVIASRPEDNWNAIDPNLVQAEDGTLWLAFGSFWSGIKLVRLDPRTGKPIDDPAEVVPIAARPAPPSAVEAPFIIHRDGYYYLFVSFDQCCNASESTYNIRVGRATAVTGPYLDRDGVGMLEGGGTLLLESSERWRGPGHNAIFRDEGGDKLVYHSYDAEYAGVPTLRIEQLEWDDDGWPVASSSR
jgi:arabinan endo-1,5-alpha-L-arabinosidase